MSCPWNSSGKSPGVGGIRFLLQEIFPTQGWNPGLLHCRRILYRLTTREAQIEIHRLGFFLSLSVPWRASLVAQLIKNLPAMRETWVWSLGWEDPLERLPTPVFCPGEFHELYCPWGHKESDMTENFHFHFQVSHENSLKILKSPASLNLILQRKVRLTQ